jgi:hypothetical protein
VHEPQYRSEASPDHPLDEFLTQPLTEMKRGDEAILIKEKRVQMQYSKGHDALFKSNILLEESTNKLKRRPGTDWTGWAGLA